jgi:hypothetical protein
MAILFIGCSSVPEEPQSDSARVWVDFDPAVTVEYLETQLDGLTKDESDNYYIDVQIDKDKGDYTVTTDLFYRTHTITEWNPISALPELNGVRYIYTIGLLRRPTATNADYAEKYDGIYIYEWTSDGSGGNDIVCVYTFANTPIYYLIAVIIAGGVGLFVYFTCKKKSTTI